MEQEIPRRTVVSPDWAFVYFDGACRPARGGGLATYGFTVDTGGLHYEDRGAAVAPGSANATNNVAEYVAAIRALEWLHGRRFSGMVVVRGDSQLVVRQMKGEYKVRAEHLKTYQRQLLELVRRFQQVEFEWVRREENLRADALSKRALGELSVQAARWK